MLDRQPPLAVVDTQVVLDCLVFHDPGAEALSSAVRRGSVHWLTTPAMRDEFVHVLSRGVGAAWQPDTLQVLRAFDRLARLVDSPPALPMPMRCSDPDDQMFIDLALSWGAQWLFTRDRALLRLARRARAHGVHVIRPADWQTSPATVD